MKRQRDRKMKNKNARVAEPVQTAALLVTHVNLDFTSARGRATDQTGGKRLPTSLFTCCGGKSIR